MGFQNNIPGVHKLVFDQLWPSGVYNPVAGDPIECHVNVEYDAMIQPSDLNAEIVEIGITLEALYSSVSKPDKNSTFIVDSKTFKVIRIQDNDRIFVTMIVVEV